MNYSKLMVLPLTIALLSGCGTKKKTVHMYSAQYDYVLNFIEEEVERKFPDIDLQIQSISTDGMKNRFLNEGKSSEADIFHAFHITNAELIIHEKPDVFYNLDDYDTSNYVDDVIGHESRHKKYHIHDRESASLIINNKVLKKHNLPKPTSYNDLLKSEYKDLIMFGNAKTCCSGYDIYKHLVETQGLEETIGFYKKLAKNVKEFTSSGSAPIKACDRGQVAIAYGPTFATANCMKENKDLEYVFFDDGLAYCFTVMGIINGKENKPGVKEVYDYIFNDLNYRCCSKYFPSGIYKNETSELECFPQDIKYGEMGDLYDFEYKQELLDKWTW